MKKWRFLSAFHNPLQIDAKDLRKRLSGRNLNKKKLKKYFIMASLAGLGCITLLFAWYAKDLPTPQGIRRNLEAQQTTKIYDRTGEHLLYAISGEQRRISIPLSSIPSHVQQAFIALEDKKFYSHKGIDFRALLRSAYYDITRRTTAYGGSTLTQQLVKNAIIQSGAKRFDRKIREAILSIELEVMFPKDKILELYLNEIPFGGQIYGIEAASETYFGKKATELTLSEGATLAAMVQRPSYYSPYGSHVDELKIRRDYALTQMSKIGYIKQAEVDTAKAQKLVTVPRRDTILAPHFVMHVRDVIEEKYGPEIFNKGLKITTTLDVEQQRFAEQAVADGAAQNRQRYGIQNAALVSLNPKTGEILSMVGSADYFDSEIGGQFNVITAKRQPGSAFKPLVYAAALKLKYNPAFVFYDLQTDFGGGYKPNNFNGQYTGPKTMREALGQSLNIPAVKALALVGIKDAIKTSEDLGITTLDQPDRYGLSLVLGAAEVKPLELAQAYGTFANGGVRQDITVVLKIEDLKGKVIEEFKPDKGRKQAIDPQIAFQMSDMLADQIAKQPIFGNLLSFGNRQVASKTGTTNGISDSKSDVRDAWTAGYVPSLVTVVWTGNNDHSPLGKGVLAANAAVPIFKQYMNNAIKSLPNESFFRPSGIKTVTIDKLSNKLPSDATPPNSTITDVFASWQVPTKQDDVHVKVRLCTGTDLLASDETPIDETEERYYASVRSEKPSDPAWEGPVRAWAEQNGLNNLPPTGKCDKFTSENRPQISISRPVNGETLNDHFTLEASASSPFNLKQIEFFIDSNSIGTSNESPFSMSYDAKQLTNGNHTIVAEAQDGNGRKNKTSISITVDKESNAPGNVSGVTITPGKGQIQINWQNPNDSDLSKTRVYVSESSGSLGLRYASEPESKSGTTSNLTLTGLSSGQRYYFTLRPVDTNQNENQSTTQYVGQTL